MHFEKREAIAGLDCTLEKFPGNRVSEGSAPPALRLADEQKEFHSVGRTFGKGYHPCRANKTRVCTFSKLLSEQVLQQFENDAERQKFCKMKKRSALWSKVKVFIVWPLLMNG